MKLNLIPPSAALLVLAFPATSPSAGATAVAEPGTTTARSQSITSTDASTKPTPMLRGGISHDTPLWDAPGDGSLWARGASYKASFDARGANFYPAFGSRAPRTFQHALSPDIVTLGGVASAFDREAPASRDGDRAQFERGAFTEIYDLVPGSMEQSFVFDTLPRSGELVLHIPVGSELEAREVPEGIEFRSEYGSVTYSRAIAIDAAGQRTFASTTLEDGAITIHVDATFLAHAALPLVIDPHVAVLNLPSSTSLDDFSADVVYDSFNYVWFTVYEEAYSANDTDVYCVGLYASGVPFLSATIDLTTDKWEAPRCAYNPAAHQILVVAGVTSNSTQLIKARTAEATSAVTVISTGPQFVVSGSDPGAKTAPDVGADSFPSGTTYYCVAYTRANPGGWSEIGVSMILPNSGFGPAYYLPGTGIFNSDSQVSVSKSNGADQFLLAWQRFDNLGHGDIYAAHVDYLGTLVDGPFSITGSYPDIDAHPCASSPIDGTYRGMVTFERSALLSSNHDIWVAAIDGTTVLDLKNLITLENSPYAAADQIEPSIDCDGRHFLVSYSEYAAPTGAYNLVVDDLYLAGSAIGIGVAHSNVPAVPGFGVNSAHFVNVAAARPGGFWSGRYAIAYEISQSVGSHDVFGDLYDVLDGGSATGYCFGNGYFGVNCPCGNFSFQGGCGNSVYAQGATLIAWGGLASTLNDTLVIGCYQMPPNAACLFFQGTTLLTGSVFGDGLRCAGGSIVRLGTKTAVSGIATYPEGGDLPITVKGGIGIEGATRGYQVWYRNAAAFCTASTFNLSNGLRVDWAR